ncbi:MAG: glycosyltransferase family 4 protein [Planctomycetota bacterium]
MHILIHDFGGYPFSAQLARNLALKNGHRVAYVCAQDSFAACTTEAPQNIPGFSMHIISQKIEKGTSLRRPFSEAAFGRQVSAKITELKPEIVVSANAPLETQNVILNCCRSRSIRFVYWLQDLHGPAITSILKAKLGIAGSLIGWHYARMEKRMLRDSNAMIVIADNFCPYLDACGVDRSKISILRNWAPLEETPRFEKNNAWAIQHGLDKKRVLMYAGTLGYKHNTSLFIGLASAFRNDNDIVVAIVSSGKKADELKAAAEANGLKNMLVLPRQPYEQLPCVLASADVLLSVLEPDASVYSVPSKVLTYLCAGRALLLMMPIDNLSARIVRECAAGVVLEPGKEDALVAAARQLFNDRDTARQCADNGRKYAETHFDITTISGQFEKILLECKS